METWRKELYANELYHYGVKGMKWRHRKTPDKPLNAVDRWTYYYDIAFAARHKYNKPNRSNKNRHTN